MAEKKTTAKASKLHAVGRRKTAKCTINLLKGEGESTVNGKKVEVYFSQLALKAAVLSPFVATNTQGKYHFTAHTSGGGPAGQADALKLAIARSLAAETEELHTALSQAGLLTRDPRAKERKKIFFVRARKKPQYSKR